MSKMTYGPQLYGWTAGTPEQGYAGYLMVFDAGGGNIRIVVRQHGTTADVPSSITLPISELINIEEALVYQARRDAGVLPND